MSEEEIRIDPLSRKAERTEPPAPMTHRLCIATKRRENTDICRYVEVQLGASAEALEKNKEQMLRDTNGVEAAICEIGQEPVWSWTVTEETTEETSTETASDGD